MRPHLRLLLVVNLLLAPLAAGCIFPDPDELRVRGANNGGTTGAADAMGDVVRTPTGDAAPPGSSDGPVDDAGGGTSVLDAMIDAPPVQTAAEACAAYADANVAAMGRCAPLLLQLAYGTQAVAQQRFRLLCPYLGLPGVNFPKRPIAPCLQALRTLACDDWFDGRTPLACQAAGDYPAGTPCSVGDQCQTSLCDLAAPVSGCGQCSPALPGAGAACHQGQFCAVGLACTANGTCARPADLNAACSPNQPCRPSLLCNGAVCVRRGKVGAACATRNDCDEPSGAVCNANAGVCVAYRAATPCGVQPDGTVNVCPAAGTCQNQNGTCAPAATDGAACDENSGPFCMQPAACVNGVCQLPGLNPACRPAAASPSENQSRSRGGLLGSVGDLLRGRARVDVPR